MITNTENIEQSKDIENTENTEQSKDIENIENIENTEQSKDIENKKPTKNKKIVLKEDKQLLNNDFQSKETKQFALKKELLERENRSNQFDFLYPN